MNLTIHATLAHAASDKLGVLRTKIDDQQFLLMYVLHEIANLTVVENS